MASSANLLAYARWKNAAHKLDTGTGIRSSRVLVASAISFDPSIGDFFAAFLCARTSQTTLVLAPRNIITTELVELMQVSKATHVVGTSTVVKANLLGLQRVGVGEMQDVDSLFPHLKLLALGGEPVPP